MIRAILHYDHQLFRLINSRWSNDFFDWLMPWMRNSGLWYPLYLFLVLLVAVNSRKNAFWWLIFGAGTAILTDFVSSSLVKENFWRLRPCNNADYSGWIHILVGYRPQSSSFTSSHAANHFGLAMFLFLTLKKRFGNWVSLFFLWALLISLAQVYVGVHYPLDITAGAMIGILIGYLSGRSFNRTYELT
ncbi:MAG: phosphatase PAP2 family protein [Chitinophagaceae bacterium]|nr:phosphatase PAP2 family protein [Chitinophagaceae bacterium]